LLGKRQRDDQWKDFPKNRNSSGIYFDKDEEFNKLNSMIDNEYGNDDDVEETESKKLKR
jgi:hypothetical protein